DFDGSNPTIRVGLPSYEQSVVPPIGKYISNNQ
ncbi:unnamed protein product, partial [Rotaria sordida]